MADTKSEQDRGLQQSELSTYAGTSGDSRPTHLDLFSGIGGFALAAQWAGFRTVAFVEIDKYCQKVLAKNFATDSERERRGKREHTSPNGNTQETALARSPRIHSDIFDLDGTAYRGVDLITGGFPCQPFSVAGKQRGAADDRAIWPQMLRVIAEARPTWIIAENVVGIVQMELDNVLSSLEGIGYACQPVVIGAVSVDARHRRLRVWVIGRRIVSDSDSGRPLEPVHTGECAAGVGKEQPARDSGKGNVSDISGKGLEGCSTAGNAGSGGQERTEQSAGLCGAQDVANSNGRGCEGRNQQDGGRCESGRTERPCRWEPEPEFCGMAVRLPEGLDPHWRYNDEWEGVPRVSKGVKDRVSRLKALGNSIQSQVAYEILREIRKLI